MDQLFKFIIDQTGKGKIDKETAIQLVKQFKEQDIKEADDIAIIGMAGKMPRANNLGEYWQNIQAGIDCITTFPAGREDDMTRYMRAVGTPEEDIRFNKNGFIEDIDKFDYKFFRLSIKEASLMDPHQRMFLETAWEAIEDAGYGGSKLTGSNTGVYVGFATSIRDSYQKQILEVDPSAIPLSMVGNLAAVLPSRISYLLDLRGPSMVIDTACSSSLVAINLACEALRDGKCDTAIAGGVKLNILPLDNEFMRIGIESSDARTRAFNDDSNGAGIGEGVCAVVLKPLKKALRDGDSVYAVIKGWAMNQDGNSVGLTAPNPAAQTDVILKAWESAKIQPETVSYIETHGTGTKLGDPIEIKGIQDAFRKFTDKTQFCAVGSLKTNIGHSSEAAGLLSLMKTVLALRHKQLPASLYFDKPNRAIRFSESPVYVNTQLRPWEAPAGTALRCGVNSFGISGTNCHVVLEEAPAQESRSPQEPSLPLLAISAKSEAALQELVRNYRDFLLEQPDVNLANICYTASTGRWHHSHRLAIHFSSREDLLHKLSRPDVLQSSEHEGIAYGTHKVVGSKGENADAGVITEQEKVALDKQAARLIEAGEIEGSDILALGTLYATGAEIQWDQLFDKKQHARLHLPVYPFERTRCWMDVPEVAISAREEEPEDQFYGVSWQATPLEIEPSVLSDWHEQTVLIFKDQGDLWERIAEQFKSRSEKLLFVEFGDAYAQRADDTFVLSGAEEDYERLLSSLREGELSRILYLNAGSGSTGVESYDALQKSQREGVYSLFYLTRALVKLGFDQGLNLNVISQGVYTVTGEEEALYPEHAPLIGIGKAINHEHPGIRIRCIDMDRHTDLDAVLKQMQDPSETYQTAYRHGVRYAEEFREMPIEQAADEPVTIKDEGLYLITGGLGGIGLEVAKYFTTKARVRLALVTRTVMPERAKWDDIISAGSNDKDIKRIAAIRAIEASGSEVILCSADVADEASMRVVIDDLRSTYGKIDGIVHGAGIPGDGFLFLKTQEAFDQVLSPKVFGTYVLDHLTKDDAPDFMICFSSGLAILSEPGHGDYTAANSYLDAYTAYRNRQGRKTLAINWTTWKETGMAVDYGFNYDTFFKAIPTEAALSGLDIVLNKKLNSVLIGEFSYIPQFLFLIDRLPLKFAGKFREKCDRVLREHNATKGPRKETRAAKPGGKVELVGKAGEAFSEIELKVAQIYNEILGFAEINIYDSFFELGGDSVMLNRMLAILNKEFPSKVKLIDLFNYTSVATLSAYISSKYEPVESEVITVQEEVRAEDYEDMLDEMVKGNLSIDEILKNMT
ncbi:type I polyketide synthase [Tumebacillus permanentifrigoris]|uniref:Phosphopantetheine binding protein n=1 Tax=Tumebacillus permanentifrigoris TaxID=378543 RepID=A0A316D4V0_9BACL|nr:type I polyketide synthase [Tumebacillus permanentifrigoris]PWK05383.1 phosphopantetheine binding protein [Tumebacillus permanentifrigoris]